MSVIFVLPNVQNSYSQRWKLKVITEIENPKVPVFFIRLKKFTSPKASSRFSAIVKSTSASSDSKSSHLQSHLPNSQLLSKDMIMILTDFVGCST